jgi:hypothetical protein
MHEPSRPVWKADVRATLGLDNHTLPGIVPVAYNL